MRWGVILVVIATLFVAGAQALYKEGVNGSLWFVFFGLFLYGVGAALFLLSLVGNQVSALFPLFALNYVWVVLVSILFFGEGFGLMKGIGVGAIVAGVAAVTWRQNG